YDELKGAGINEEKIKSLNQQLQTEKEKNKVLEGKLSVLPPPISIKEESIIKKVKELLNSAINPLKQEIEELLKKQAANNSSLNKSPTELPTDYELIKADKEELLKIFETLKLKISESEEEK
ncbi:10061_t:CDS:1, partial [Funneliformis geosporum]